MRHKHLAVQYPYILENKINLSGSDDIVHLSVNLLLIKFANFHINILIFFLVILRERLYSLFISHVNSKSYFIKFVPFYDANKCLSASLINDIYKFDATTKRVLRLKI